MGLCYGNPYTFSFPGALVVKANFLAHFGGGPFHLSGPANYECFLCNFLLQNFGGRS